MIFFSRTNCRRIKRQMGMRDKRIIADCQETSCDSLTGFSIANEDESHLKAGARFLIWKKKGQRRARCSLQCNRKRCQCENNNVSVTSNDSLVSSSDFSRLCSPFTMTSPRSGVNNSETPVIPFAMTVFYGRIVVIFYVWETSYASYPWHKCAGDHWSVKEWLGLFLLPSKSGNTIGWLFAKLHSAFWLTLHVVYEFSLWSLILIYRWFVSDVAAWRDTFIRKKQ